MRILLRIFKESVAIAIRELRVNKLRTILTLLGISIGIFCVISIFSSVDSLENNLRTSINKFGSNVIYVTKFPWAPEEGETEYPGGNTGTDPMQSLMRCVRYRKN